MNARRAWLRLLCVAAVEHPDAATSRADARIAYALATGVPPDQIRPTSGCRFHDFDDEVPA